MSYGPEPFLEVLISSKNRFVKVVIIDVVGIIRCTGGVSDVADLSGRLHCGSTVINLIRSVVSIDCVSLNCTGQAMNISM